MLTISSIHFVYVLIAVARSHFLRKPSSICDMCSLDWTPNQNLGYDFHGISVTSDGRYERLQGLNEMRRSECASALLELTCHPPSDENEEVDEEAANIEDSTVKECETEITLDYIRGLEKENASLKEKFKMSSFNEDSFREDNDEVLFFYWMQNWSLLLCLFNVLRNSSPQLKSSMMIWADYSFNDDYDDYMN